MTVAELIAILNGQQQDTPISINVGGTQVENFEVTTSGGVVTLQGREGREETTGDSVTQ